MTQPNIIFVLTDQQRWDTCGCYGQALPVTPHLDSMSVSGVRFEHAFTCQPVCGPSRACLQTGRYPSATGNFRNHIALPNGERTLAHRLGEAGYETSYIGKWHLATNLQGKEPYSYIGTPLQEIFLTCAVPPERRGGYEHWLASDSLEDTSHAYDGYMFDTFGKRRNFPAGRYRADVLGDWTLEYLSSRRNEKPFFLFLSFIEPHQQNDHDRYEGPYGSREQWANFTHPGDLSGTTGNWRDSYPDYLGCCHAVDANIGRIRAWLAETGLDRNTLLIFTSDHGCHFKTRNTEYKRSCHEASIRVPLVIEGPGFTGGRVVPELVSLIDLPPTVMQAAGVPVPPSMQGAPLQQLTEGNRRGWQQEVLVQITEDHIGRAIRTPLWKYEVWVPSNHYMSGWARGDSDVYHEHHLYDLTNDPFEQNDLVQDQAYAEVRASLSRILKRRIVEAGEQEPIILPATRNNKIGEI